MKLVESKIALFGALTVKLLYDHIIQVDWDELKTITHKTEMTLANAGYARSYYTYIFLKAAKTEIF
jgi:hypothetical protein